ncbi:MAG: TonB-dependent receptor, partial [Acidobacteria bacterium]|nr:TonB-dependent receptor [Acidobacteriota bacterium]
EHSLRFGSEIRVLRESNLGYGNYTPNLGFASTWTRGPLDNSPPAPIGQGLASFLLGLPTGGYIDRNESYAQQSTYQAWYLHDDWKITRTLTLNLGLRYEYEGPTTERYNRSNRGFDFTTPNPVQDRARANYARSPIPQIPVAEFRTPGGLLFAGTSGQPRTLWNGNNNNWAPRIGIAWLVRPKTALRLGYGIFYQSLGTDRNDVGQQGFDQRTSLTPSNDNGRTFTATLSNPFPDGFLAPLGAANGLRTFLGRSPSFFTPSRRNGYLQRWSFTVQRELPGRMMVEAGYTGSKSVGLGIGFNYDSVPVEYLSRSPERDQAAIDFLSANVPNPFRGIEEFEGTAWYQNANLPRSQLLTPFPHFNGISTTLSDGFSWYHSGHIRFERRFSRGILAQAAYTWSKFMEAVERLNAQDLLPHHVISPQDRPHHIVISGQYEFPFGRGKLVSSRFAAVNHVIGGWSTQAIYQWQSGPPIGFGNILFRGQLADVVLPRSERAVERWFNINAGFERDSTRQLASNYRTFPLRLTGLRADGWNNWDLSLFKTLRFTERVSLQLRAEAQDAFNHAMFQPPNTAPVNTLFGTVNATIWGEQRKVTVAAKLLW